MIFKQIDELLSGQKTQTRRVCKSGESWSGQFQTTEGYSREGGIYTVWNGERIKWEVGRTYAVVPKRGKPSVWWKRVGTVALTHNGMHEYHYPSNPDAAAIALPVTRAELEKRGFQPLRIRIVAIRREHLQVITEADALAEGVASVDTYRKLWESINKNLGVRWSNNPMVWVLTFEVER